jgi:hypothetical protein
MHVMKDFAECRHVLILAGIISTESSEGQTLFQTKYI